MKNYSLVLCSLLISIFVHAVFSQTDDSNLINRDNYFDYFLEPTAEYSLTISWLSRDEIIKTINEELKFKGYRITQTVLYKLENDTFIALPAYDFYNKTGYFYQGGHGPCINDRSNPKIYLDYVIEDGVGTMFDLGPLPKNIIVFKEDWYWYQNINPFSNEINKKTITKEKIIAILKEDVNYFFGPPIQK